jgi:hypothetical protein
MVTGVPLLWQNHVNVDFTELNSSVAIKIGSFVIYAELSSLLLVVGVPTKPCLPNALL